MKILLPHAVACSFSLAPLASPECELSATSFAQLLQHVRECADAARNHASLGWHMPHAAAYLGHTAILQLMLLINPSAAEARAYTQSIPMHFSALGCQRGAVELLLQVAPHTATSVNRDKWTPLHSVAAGPGMRARDATGTASAAVVELLLRAAPASATALTTDGSTPL